MTDGSLFPTLDLLDMIYSDVAAVFSLWNDQTDTALEVISTRHALLTWNESLRHFPL